MPEATITVREYEGSLAYVDLIGSNDLILNDFGASTEGKLVDDDGQLDSGDDGVSTFDGAPVNFIGSGSVQPHLLIVGLGEAKPVVAFEAAGKTYFAFPDGEPNFLTAVSMRLELSDDPGEVFTPVCFCRGTLIATLDGEVPIEDLQPGDMVLDASGIAHRIRWTSGRKLHIPLGVHGGFAKWLPVHIPADAFGPGRPHRPLHVSQQHRILLEGAGVELFAGMPQALAPAKSLVGDLVHIDRRVREVEYHHILCDRHVVLLANGLPAESLLPGDVLANALPNDSWQEVLGIFPELDQLGVSSFRPAAPILKGYEAAVIRRFAEA
ncbi:Hint domain-containing protein [Brevirhabdus sp.]|uniref:Hint domain-containing protein n=1 Tax=Brevirhabdus sp. TaxID=2004514 RepID=UPI004059F33A